MTSYTTPWRVGRTLGGALGIWSKTCRADEPDVCTVAMVPNKRDEVRAALIVRAVNSFAEAREAVERLLKFNEELCDDVGVSKHYPSADFARKVLAKMDGAA